MSGVVSIRMPSGLERLIRLNAAHSHMLVSDVPRLILEHALCGQYSFSALQDVPEFLEAKLDIRLSDELISRLRTESQRLRVSVSVYIRTILYAYYTKRLVFIETGECYTLGENHDQTKSA